MGKIVILDENTANQIAAGEVIERPSSVVKEMVENALDAKATSITVDITNGGIKSIRITDNGEGIAADDAVMSFERYATSKIKSIDDLNSLTTMGFRGEALASIAAVSKLEVITKTEEAESGTKVVIEGGDVLSVEPVGAPKGTTFIVRELFYNTPARYKFLKKDSVEAGYIQDILTRIALARPDISIKYINNGKTIMHTPGNHDLLSAIYSIYGKDIARSVLPIKLSYSGIYVSGFIGKPEISRRNRSFQTVLVNGRFVYNRIVTAAVEEAYKTRLMQKRFPFAVVKLDIHPQLVDVNVHPSKLEVRFSDEQKVFRAVYQAVFAALSESSHIPEVTEKDRLIDTSASYGGKPKDDKDYKTTDYGYKLESQNKTGLNSRNYRPETGTQIELTSHNYKQQTESQNAFDYYANEAKETMQYKTGHNFIQQVEIGSPDRKDDNGQAIKHKLPGYQEKTHRISESKDEKLSHGAQPANESEPCIQEDRREMLLHTRIIGQAFETYILLEFEDKILLIDQHAAHERIRYEKIRQQYISHNSFSQGLLSPITVNLSELEMEKFYELSDYIKKLGFEVEIFGSRTVLIRAVPYILDSSFSGMDFLDILEKLHHDIKTASVVSEIIPEETLFMMACKSAIKANRNMSDMEIRGLVDDLAKTENPYNCVHGRPVIISIAKNELEKRFKRII